ncbi:MAG: cob(I)yrinic acid a,c-diamide adenosyltransferase [Candidatus Peregrinibacteria bacterium]
MSIVTRTGDDGTTGLIGGGRISKASARMHVTGSVDELNAVLGLVVAEKDLSPDCFVQLLLVQQVLFAAGADIASPSPSSQGTRRILPVDVSMVETWIQKLEKQLPPLKRFIRPNGGRTGSLLHLARTVCRRAERWVVSVSESEEVNPLLLKYLNRLSDYFFLAARSEGRRMGMEEVEV